MRVKILDEAIDKLIIGLHPRSRSAKPRAGDRLHMQQGREGHRPCEGEEGWCKKAGEGSKAAARNPLVVNPERVEKYLGVPRFRNRLRRTEARVGSVTGLAWTSVGGEILHVDVTVMTGSEKLTLTGQLGEVMKESAQAALSYLRSKARSFGLTETISRGKRNPCSPPRRIDPEGRAVGRDHDGDGHVLRAQRTAGESDVAMTGEITLRGEVLAIGGLNEKLLAAQRSGITKVLIPQENVKDLSEIPERVKEGLTIVPISKIEEALPHVFPKTGAK